MSEEVAHTEKSEDDFGFLFDYELLEALNNAQAKLIELNPKSACWEFEFDNGTSIKQIDVVEVDGGDTYKLVLRTE